MRLTTLAPKQTEAGARLLASAVQARIPSTSIGLAVSLEGCGSSLGTGEAEVKGGASGVCAAAVACVQIS